MSRTYFLAWSALAVSSRAFRRDMDDAGWRESCRLSKFVKIDNDSICFGSVVAIYFTKEFGCKEDAAFPLDIRFICSQME